MEKNVSSVKILNIIICLLLLVVFAIFTGTKKVDAKSEASGEYPSRFTLGYQFKELKFIYKEATPKEEILVYNLEYYIENNLDIIKFYSKVFDYNLEDVLNDLKEREKNNSTFISTNIGYLKNEKGELRIYDSFEYGLIEYFYNLMETKTIKRNIKYIPYEGNSSYVEKLIMHYSSIYSNVDQTTLLSIGAAESGYYKVKYMLRSNNIYGGMSSKGLIRHNNIELGVLSYVRMMSKYYYGKGLNTPELIGRIYCPVFENGTKVASSHWLNLVSTAKNKYNKYDFNITINDIINKEELA